MPCVWGSRLGKHVSLIYLSTGCSGTPQNINGTSGVITSPNYPGNYDSNQRCVWRITVPSGMGVRLSFTSFNLESTSSCNYDYVEIRNGSSGSSPILGKYCGSSTPIVPRAYSGSIFVTFRSDGSNSYKGFNATFAAINIPKGTQNDIECLLRTNNSSHLNEIWPIHLFVTSTSFRAYPDYFSSFSTQVGEI